VREIGATGAAIEGVKGSRLALGLEPGAAALAAAPRRDGRRGLSAQPALETRASTTTCKVIRVLVAAELGRR
jgi:hypothetical protein